MPKESELLKGRICSSGRLKGRAVQAVNKLSYEMMREKPTTRLDACRSAAYNATVSFILDVFKRLAMFGRPVFHVNRQNLSPWFASFRFFGTPEAPPSAPRRLPRRFPDARWRSAGGLPLRDVEWEAGPLLTQTDIIATSCSAKRLP